MTREAIRRYGSEVRTRVNNGDSAWLDAEFKSLTELATKGARR